MKSYGADSLYLAPEYLGEVNAVAAMVVGVAIGVFIMSWNITTFILFSRHFRFLATASNPFLKYCINNAVIPLLFLVFYFSRAIYFNYNKELASVTDIIFQVLGFLFGLALLIAISFVYFFRYDKRIIRILKPVISNPQLFKSQFKKEQTKLNESRLIKVEWFLQSPLSVKKVRDISHYSKEFIETIFSRHHFAAIVSIFVAFIFLILVGFLLDNRYFQLPAAAGITIFFAILIAVSGAFSYFMQSWSILFLIGLIVVFNLLYKYNIIDTSNKAYGLNYSNKEERPEYNRESLLNICREEVASRDKQDMIAILEAWKKKQKEAKPLMFLINTSGGGNRSATFTFNVLQRLDSLTGGELMQKTFLITGASGGMLGATYFRALERERSSGKKINLQSVVYSNNIAGDLLNPLFSSFVARDLAAPAQKFKVGNYQYVKDRGYAFEEKLNENTDGVLNKRMGQLYEDEKNARIPLAVFNSVISQDGRKLLISTQKLTFLMRPAIDTSLAAQADPDAIDYQSFFAKQDPMNLRLLSALRMNATFPYVLPNVWLPTKPVVDVMDAGLRDNFGQETAIRFVQVFNDWIKENTSGVVMVQIRDRKTGGWENPFEAAGISEIVTRPMLLLQYNWYKMQEYNQNDIVSLAQKVLGPKFYKISFQYAPSKEEARAALNFHLTKLERLDIRQALEDNNNQAAFKYLLQLNQNSKDSSTKHE